MGKAFRGRKRMAAAAARGPAVVNGKRLTQGQRERLAEAEVLAAGTWRDRQRAVFIVRQVEAELAAARASSAVERGIEDTLQRAQARSEVFEIETVDVGEWRRNDMGGLARRDGAPILDVQTVRRASRIDGLASAHKAGAISDDDKRVGDAYRVLLEAAQPPVGTSQYGAHLTSVPDKERSMAAAMLRGYAALALSEIARRIADPKTAAVLDAVAGRGATIRSLGDTGSLKAANRDRLIAGLAVAKEVLDDLNRKRLANQAR